MFILVLILKWPYASLVGAEAGEVKFSPILKGFSYSVPSNTLPSPLLSEMLQTAQIPSFESLKPCLCPMKSRDGFQWLRNKAR